MYLFQAVNKLFHAIIYMVASSLDMTNQILGFTLLQWFQKQCSPAARVKFRPIFKPSSFAWSCLITPLATIRVYTVNTVFVTLTWAAYNEYASSWKTALREKRWFQEMRKCHVKFQCGCQSANSSLVFVLCFRWEKTNIISIESLVELPPQCFCLFLESTEIIKWA